MRALLTALAGGAAAAAESSTHKKRRKLGTIRVKLSGPAASPNVNIKGKGVQLGDMRDVGYNTVEFSVFE